MTELTLISLEEGIERYKAGEEIEKLLVIFKDLSLREPKNATVWACLAWLYLLLDKPKTALKAAQKSVKLDGKSPQGRVNLALAILDAGEKGIRPHIEVAAQIMALDSQISQDVKENIEDGLQRKPGWASLEKIKTLLLGGGEN
jgi:predicted Zn-dependent protease